MNAFEKKKYLAEILGELYEICKNKRKYLGQDYVIIGKSTEQSKHWKTGELLWDDEEKTIPHYENIYDYVDKEELTEEDKGRIAVISEVMRNLEKML